MPTTSPDIQLVSCVGAGIVQVTVPAGSPTVNFYADNSGGVLLAAVTAGNTAFLSTNGAFYFAASPAGLSAFTATQISSNTDKVYQLLTGGTAVTNATAETVSAQYQIPANLLVAGSTLKIRYKVEVSGVTGTPTLQHILRLGSAGTTADTALVTSVAATASTTTVGSGEFLITVRAAPSATTSLVGTGTAASIGTVAAPTAMDAAALAPTNFATNAALFLTVTLTWSAANASNIAAVTMMEVEVA